MPSLNKKSVDFQGLIPSIDPRKPAEPYVIAGKNFIFDVDGPKSQFGAEFQCYDRIENPKYTESFTVNAKIIDADGVDFTTQDYEFVFTQDAVLIACGELRMFFPVHTYADISGTPYHWTSAVVGTHVFFCHPAIGILHYNLTTGIFGKHTSASLPNNPRSITVSHGRLIILGDTFVVWSAQDDGFDVVSSTATGAGAQAYSLVGGDPLVVEAYATGFLTFTTKGIMRSQFTGDVVVWRHRALTSKFQLINSFCVTKLDTEEIVFLDKTGFYKTAGELPTRWQPLFSEFLIKELEKFDLTLPGIIRMTLVQEMQLMFLSFQILDNPPFSYSFSLHIPTDKWGRLDHAHYAIIKILITAGVDKGFNWGHIDNDGHFSTWKGIARFETFPVDTLAYLYKPERQYPVRYNVDNGHYIMPSVMHMGTRNEDVLGNQTMGYYTYSLSEFEDPILEEPQLPDTSIAFTGDDWLIQTGSEDWLVDSGDEDWNDTPDNILGSVMTMVNNANRQLPVRKIRQYTGLNAQIIMGLIRYEELEHNDEMGLVTNMSIGMTEGGDIDAVFEDWNTVPDDTENEDWNLLSGSEDWGDNPADLIDYNVNVIATNDGHTEFNSVIPDIAVEENAQRYYTMLISGVWHKVDIEALTVGQSFHLKSLELAGSVAGRI